MEEDLLNRAKIYAEQHQTSLSHLIEAYLERLTKKPSKVNVITLVKRLQKPKSSSDVDLKKQYYEERKGKYGF